ncbi:Non-specific serine/threonine protein kinase [Bertholletia excelsa]
MASPLNPVLYILVIVGALSVCVSAGLRVPSFAAASVLLHLNLGTPGSQSFLQSDQVISPVSTSPSFGWKRPRILAPPPYKAFHALSPTYASSKAPTQYSIMWQWEKAYSPYMSSFKHPAKNWVHGSASSPLVSHYKHHYGNNKINFVPGPSNQFPSSYNGHQGVGPTISPIYSPYPVRTPSPEITPSQLRVPISVPITPPLSSYVKRKASPPPTPLLVLPPPPPNADCASVTCTEPLTYTAPGSPCGCVWPIKVQLQLTVALYTFFPLVSELAKEIAGSVSLNRSQVRVMGANAASEQLEKTIVLVNLVPSRDNFDWSTAFLIYKKFWKKQVCIKTSLFGAYEVLYIHYPGLPPSPPMSSDTYTVNDQPDPDHDNNGRTIQPLGVDVPRKRRDQPHGSMIAVIILSSAAALVVCMAVIWLLLLKCSCIHQPKETPHVLMSSLGKLSGTGGPLTCGRKLSSGSMSFNSGVLMYTGTAKLFSLNDIEKATYHFDASRILGEGGFGLVYSGVLDDGRKVAVKVLKRDDQRGGREFLAEVEMLSRLHHRNLVKLIGICTEDHTRCLVYELVPNGSVESHLHGVDKEAAPLDWDSRMRIALGAARGLAYLHEDSSPRVIHRDFKSSNILLEHDFTPKVSDFGLARTALDEGNKHISTHVMGTFGYLAPEYAMTGHLLVKSDVYSYGVVLLELLTGRKPVDLSRPPGQENLVGWARPLLTTKEGLEAIIDPSLKPHIPFDSATKIAAIASMCVQPEVSHRPFMGEVVQALKLFCNEFDETKEPMSRSFSQDDLAVHLDGKASRVSGELLEASRTHYLISQDDSILDSKIVLLEEGEVGSFRKHYKSAPLKMGRGRQLWQRLTELSKGSMSEHGLPVKHGEDPINLPHEDP